MVLKARAGLVGLGVGLTLAAEEMISGSIAEEIENNDLPFRIDLEL